ncbi:type II toxin-antitoxin system HicB family antitoxin [Companilactobacillus insicii]|uniref:type II toxin-antitoxin system HicB family antitoxin n=1 Tax=Companilactobacillus insicii TaxID=1732567 RepID=UPI000F789F95|nr:type II toxin-antitoxin system HicB family antitoxin [Companilactobacillus insicii]
MDNQEKKNEQARKDSFRSDLKKYSTVDEWWEDLNNDERRIVAYPAILDDRDNSKNIYTVTFPDVPGAISEGTGLAEAVYMASEAMGLMLYDREELPVPSDLKTIENENPDCAVTFVSADLNEISKNVRVPMVNINTTISSELAMMAEERNIDLSEILIEALKNKLNAK